MGKSANKTEALAEFPRIEYRLTGQNHKGCEETRDLVIMPMDGGYVQTARGDRVNLSRFVDGRKVEGEGALYLTPEQDREWRREACKALGQDGRGDRGAR